MSLEKALAGKGAGRLGAATRQDTAAPASAVMTDWIRVRIRKPNVHGFRKRTRRKWLRVHHLPVQAAPTWRKRCGAKLVWQVHPDDVAAIHREWGEEPEPGGVYYVDAHQVVVPRRRGKPA